MLAVLVASALQVSFHLNPPPGLERTWLGPDFWANNLQDWQVKDGKYVCTETRANFPIRTAQMMTVQTDGDFNASVKLGYVAGVAPGWTGLIIGAGGKKVDYRITALVHNSPAEDGGMIVGVDETGKPFVRDFSQGGAGDNGWTLQNKLDLDKVPEYKGVLTGSPQPGDVKLGVNARRGGDNYTVTLTGTQNGREVWTYKAAGIPADRVEGGFGVMSNLGGKGHTYSDLTISGSGFHYNPTHEFGPVTQTMWTLQGKRLKLTALGVPLGDKDPVHATLEVQQGGNWTQVDETDWHTNAFCYQFEAKNLEINSPTPYRVVTKIATDHGEEARTYRGMLIPEPKANVTTAAVFTCFKSFTGNLKWNGNSIWAPHQEVVDAVNWQKPDILLFTGDQIYEGDLTPARLVPDNARLTYLDYLSKYYRFAIGMGELTRNYPSILMPDDHDVYHGNIWGAGGKQAKAHDGITAQDSGGYKGHRDFVNAIHESLTWHMPDPFDPTPVGDLKIEPYACELEWGGVSYAVVADRMFKDSATVLLPEAKIVNGWSRNPDFDMAKDSDVPTAHLLGDMQLRFLKHWAEEKNPRVQFKAVVSQTVFQNPATIPDEADGGEVIPSLPILPDQIHLPKNFKIAADCDSNGWPQSGRNRALRLFKEAGAIHLCGDQHLGTLTEYGIDSFRDGGYAFCVPAVANTWPRRWYPPMDGMNRAPGAPAYTGDFIDGFGNKMTIWAAANPYQTHIQPEALYNRTPGYGIVRFNKKDDTITFECWPRWVKPWEKGAKQYIGWPKTIKNSENK